MTVAARAVHDMYRDVRGAVCCRPSAAGVIPFRMGGKGSPAKVRLVENGSNCQYLWIKIFLCGLLGGGHVVGPFDEFAFLELGAGTDERHEMGCVDRAPA